MQLHFKEYGQGEPLIILHGLFGSLENWQAISEGLSDAFHIFALDQRNHGRSPHSMEMNYAVMARDIGEFMVQHSLPSTHLLGHSMGGKAAMQFALSQPDKVNKLIIADVAPRIYARSHEHIFKAMLALDPKQFKTRQEIEVALEPEIPEWTVRRFLMKNLTRDANGAFQWRINLPALYQHYDEINQAPAAGTPFEKPTLFICGAQSDYISDADLPEIQRLFPQAEIHTIPNTSHWLHAEAPVEFIRVTREFLGK
jgi:pimeloyl-ACP methyl ester carboxylesterase